MEGGDRVQATWGSANGMTHEGYAELAANIPDLLAADSIIAIVRGRTEVGPRALGHRSLLASAASAGMKERLNHVKHRQ